MSAPPKLNSAAPVFQVRDVGDTMRWYETHLGFRPHPFPTAPPHAYLLVFSSGPA